MTGHSKKKDILSDILNDPHTDSIRGLNELQELIHLTGNEEKPKRARVKVPAVRKKKVKKKVKKKGKRKSTHYLNEDVFDNLGETKKIIKDLLPAGNKLKATKSRIVESAVKVLLDEFERKGAESYLVKELTRKE